MAVIEYYKPSESYLIYAEETVWGTPGTPSQANKIGIVTNFTWNGVNNFIRSQSIGAGNNATSAVLGNFDLTGTIDFDVNDFTFLQYAIGIKQAAYELAERDRIGYEADNTPSITLELGSEGDTTDDVLQFTGVVFEGFNLSGSAGETLKCSMDWTAKTIASSSTLEAYTASTDKPYVFQNGSVTIGSDAFHVSSFNVSMANNLDIFRDTGGGRFISQPQRGLRRYDFTFTAKMKGDTTASVLSGTEARSLFFNGVTTSTSPATGESSTAFALNISINVTGGDTVDIDLSNCYFENISEPVPLDGGVIEQTFSGFGLSGLLDGTDYVPIRWTEP